MELFFATGDREMQTLLDGLKVETEGRWMDEKIRNPNGTRKRLYRLFITCCAADSRAIPIVLEFGKEPPEFPENGWVKVSGTMRFPLEEGVIQPVLLVDRVARRRAAVRGEFHEEQVILKKAPHPPPEGHVLVPAAAIGALSILLAVGLDVLRILEPMDRMISKLVSQGAVQSFPKTLPAWSVWLVTVVLAFGLSFAILSVARHLAAAGVVAHGRWCWWRGGHRCSALAAHFPDIGAPFDRHPVVRRLRRGLCRQSPHALRRNPGKTRMRHVDFPEPVKALIGELKRLPGIGPRSAERIAVWLLQSPKANPTQLADSLLVAKENGAPLSGLRVFRHGIRLRRL